MSVVSAAPRTSIGQSSRSATRAMAGLALSMLMASLDTSIANSALPTLARAFNAPFQHVQWVVLAYLLAVTTLIVSAGRLGDIVGRKRLLMVGIAVFTIGSLLCGAAPALWLLVGARAMQGIGAAVMMALTVAFVGELAPASGTARSMGLLGTMSAVGTALGPSLGGLLVSVSSWHAIFLLNVPLGALCFYLASKNLAPDDRAQVRKGFDSGTALLAGALGAYAIAMTLGKGQFGALNWTLLGIALAAGLVFVRRQARASSPLLELSLLRDRVLASSLAMNTLVSTVIMSTLVVGPFYLAEALRLGATQVGLALSVGPAVVALSGVPAGRLAYRFGLWRTAFLGLLAMGTGATLLSLSSTALGLAGYLFPIVLVTAGYALFQTSNNTQVMSGASAGQRGVVSGVLTLSRNLGLVTGASVMGALFANVSRGPLAGSVESVAIGMRATFAVGAGLIALTLLIGVAVSRR